MLDPASTTNNSTHSGLPARAQPWSLSPALENPSNLPMLDWSNASYGEDLAPDGFIAALLAGMFEWHGSDGAYGDPEDLEPGLQDGAQLLAPAEGVPVLTTTTTSSRPELPADGPLRPIREQSPLLHRSADIGPQQPAQAQDAAGAAQAPRLAPLLVSPRVLPASEIVPLSLGNDSRSTVLVIGDIAAESAASAETLESLLVGCAPYTPLHLANARSE